MTNVAVAAVGEINDRSMGGRARMPGGYQIARGHYG